MKIEVLAKDIETGKRTDTWFCPVALALWRITNKRWLVYQDDCCPLGESSIASAVHLPARAQHWIERFDDTGLGKPFEFELPVAA